jgi:cell division protein FtsI (penicillin-binding protein 3)
MSETSPIDRRFIVFISVFAAAAALVLIRYGVVMLAPRSPAAVETGSEYLGIRGPGRGRIVDRNGRILAIETRVGNVAVMKDSFGPIEGDGEEIRQNRRLAQETRREEMLEDLRRLAGKLGPALDMAPEELFNRIAAAPSSFVYVKKQVSMPVLDVLESIRNEAIRTRRSLWGVELDRRRAAVTVKKSELRDQTGLSELLAPLLGLSPLELRDRIDASSRNTVDLKTRADLSLLNRIESMIAEAELTERSMQRLRLERGWGRLYPEHSLAGQVVGFVGDDNKGLEGIEMAFDPDLAPAEEGKNGNSVVLTIDVNVQYILEEISRRTLEENKAEAVMFLAMDPRTGDILGSASLPNYDPNNFKDYGESVWNNRPAIWAYEPGSVFKVFSLASFLDAGVIRGDTVFVCNGHYERVTSRGERIVIGCLAAHGRVSARDIIVYSCNAGAAYAADQMGAEAFYTRLRDFGFGSRPGSGTPEAEGILRELSRWSERSKPTIAMGQEIAVSALQMLQAASAVANDGLLVPPRIVSRIESAEGTVVRTYEPGSPRQVLRPGTARAMRSYMNEVTSNIGTGWRAKGEDLSLAVKTGTAQSSSSSARGYSSTDFIASCIALLPAESPSLILYLVIVKPQGESIYGGRIAAPPIREAAEALIDYLGIPRGRNRQLSHPGAVTLTGRSLPELSGRMPDFSGYAKRELLPLLLREDYLVDITGEGWVRRQNPPPGTPLSPGMTLTLELE